MTGTSTVTTPFVPSATNSAPANSCRCSQFPPAFVGRAARPRAPTPPANATPMACIRQSRAELGALREVLPAAGQNRVRLPRCGASAALLALWSTVLGLGARGRPATPPTAHPLGRVPSGAGAPFGVRSADKCGGYSRQKSETVASGAIHTGREGTRIYTGSSQYSHCECRDSSRVPRRQAPP